MDNAATLTEAWNSVVELFARMLRDYPGLTLLILLLVVYLGRRELRIAIAALIEGLGAIIVLPAQWLDQLWRFLYGAGMHGTAAYSRMWGRTLGVSLAIAVPILLLAIVGATVNYFLMLRPLSDMFGAYAIAVGGLSVPAAELAAWAILGFEFLVGMALMEELGWTPMFPKAEQSGHAPNKIIVIALVTLLALFSIFEVLLAYHREVLIEQDSVLRQVLGIENLPLATDAPANGEQEAGVGTDTIPTIGQALIGGMMPWILMLASHFFKVVFTALPTTLLFLFGFAARLLYLPFFVLAFVIQRAQLVVLALFDFVAGVLEKIAWPFEAILRALFPQRAQ